MARVLMVCLMPGCVAEMWYHVFLWSLFSSIIIHMLASSIAFGSLRRHKSLRFGPLLVLMSGVVTPLTAYSITSAAVAGVHRAASFQMYPLYAMFWGCGQTLVTLVFSFTRVLATLWPNNAMKIEFILFIICIKDILFSIYIYYAIKSINTPILCPNHLSFV